jgi:hypothetical protein
LCGVEPKAYLLHATPAALTNPCTVTRPRHLLTKGPLMMVAMGLGWLLSLGLVGSLIVLVWLVIGRLRRPPASGWSARARMTQP